MNQPNKRTTESAQQPDVQILVTAYVPNVKYLKYSGDLLNKFCPLPRTIDVAHESETKVEQLYRLKPYLDDYFILMEEDFYVVAPVDTTLLYQIYAFCTANAVDRFSLQTKDAHGHPDFACSNRKLGEHALYACTSNAHYPMALEASIWRRDFLFSYLHDCETDRDIERIRPDDCVVYALEHSVIDYRDAMRGGKTEVRLHTDPLRLEGPALALYPQGDCKEEVLYL